MCHLYSATIESPCFTLERNATSYELRQYHADEVCVVVWGVGGCGLVISIFVRCFFGGLVDGGSMDPVWCRGLLDLG